MIWIKDIIQLVEEQFPKEIQENWDNSGLQIGDLNTPCTGVLLTLDVTEELIQEAISERCNLIVAHHPLLFRGVKHIGVHSYIERCIHLAIKHDINIYAAHTNADKASLGLNHHLAQALGLRDIEVLTPDDAFKDLGVGLGVIGSLDKEVAYQEYLGYLSKHFDTKQLKHNKYIPRYIKKVALCGGSAASLWRSALGKGADIYITGEAKYNDYFDAEGISLVTVGHYESEFAVTSLFDSIISTRYKGITKITRINHNPVQVFK